MAVVWDEQMYRDAYNGSFHGGVEFFYERTSRWRASVILAKRIVQKLALDGTHRVVIFGCGFGWLDEALRLQGIDAIGTDTSPWIQSAWTNGTGETGSSKKPLNQNGRNNGSRNKIRQEFAGNNDPTHVISENVLTGFSDVEIADMAQWDNFTNAAIIHITSVLEDPAAPINFPTWNWKIGSEWRTLFDGLGLSHHRIFDANFREEFM